MESEKTPDEGGGEVLREQELENMEEISPHHEEEEWMRVHSLDLPDLVAEEAERAREKGAYADVVIRCEQDEEGGDEGDEKEEKTRKPAAEFKAHRVVLAATSPFLKKVLKRSLREGGGEAEPTTLVINGASPETVSLLLEVVYCGSVEASLGELRELILLARELRVQIPVSEDLLELLEVPPPPPDKEEEEEEEESYVEEKKQAKVKEEVKAAAPLKRKRGRPPKNSLPKPPPLKRIKENLPRRSAPNNLSEEALLGEYEEEPPVAPSPSSYSPATDPNGGFLCPFCNARYGGAVAFKHHLKYHESEALKEQRDQMLAEMVSACFRADASAYECAICGSNYSHPGNFKQHLGRHERETGAVTAYFQRVDPDNAHLYAAPQPGVSPFSGKGAGDDDLAGEEDCNPRGGNSHLTAALRSSVAAKGEARRSRGPGSSSEYFCDVCGRTFRHAGNYRQHMASHMRVSSITFPSHLRSALDGSANGGGGAARKAAVDQAFDSGAEALGQQESSSHSVDSGSVSVSQGVEGEEGLVHDHAAAAEAMMQEEAVEEQEMGGTSSVPQAFSCPVCNKTFGKMSKLRVHMKVHSEDRFRHPCKVCGKMFSRQQHVERHMLIHTGAKPFKCSNCSKGFTREDKLKDHYQRGCQFVEGREFTAPAVEGEGDGEAAAKRKKGRPKGKAVKKEEEEVYDLYDEEDEVFEDDEDFGSGGGDPLLIL